MDKIPNRYEEQYRRSLEAVIKEIWDTLFGLTDPYEIVRKLRDMPQNPVFIEYCNTLAYTMVTHVKKQVEGNWRKAALINGKGREIYSALINELANTSVGYALRDQIIANASLIKTLPTRIAGDVVRYIEAEAMKGRRASEIAKDISEKFPNNYKANAALIARTEVSKTQCALTKARAEALGLDWYIWRTSKDARVRNSHDLMDGVMVRWREPPNPERLNGEKESQIKAPYHAGMIYNCRCYAEPVIDIDYASFPCDVHYGGRITKNMKKDEFLKIM